MIEKSACIAGKIRNRCNELNQAQKNVPYFLGIDGGGSKTDFVLADENGNLVNRITLGACNPVDIGEEEALLVLKDGISQVCGSISFSDISVFAGIAGSSTGDYAHKINRFLRSFNFSRVHNGSDAMNAVALGLGNRDGIIVILGTGAVAFTKESDKITKTGGYGFLFGDKGSGYSLGRDALLAAMEAEDGCGEATVLREYVLKKENTKTVSERLSLFYAGGKRLLASYAPLIFDAWEVGDTVATRILEDNMQAVARMIINASNKMSYQKDIPVVFFGSITKQEHIILPIIRKFLKKESSTEFRYRLTVCTEPVYKGALLMAGMKEKGCKHNAEN